MKRSLIVALVLPSLRVPHAWSQEHDPAHDASWQIHADFDAALFLHSRSNAIGNAVKPAVRVTVDRPMQLGPLSKLRLGGQAFAVLDASPHYRVWGAMASASLPLFDGTTFDLLANASLGAGINADILHKDLNASIPVIPYGSLGLRATVEVHDKVALGIQLYWNHLSVLTFGMGAMVSL